MNDDDEGDDDDDELFLWNHIFEITEYIYIADVYFDQEKLQLQKIKFNQEYINKA